MPRPEVEEFAQVLVARVRDDAIRECDMCTRPEVENPVARRWRALGASPEVLRALIPDIVDEAICTLLRAIDQEGLRLKFVASNGSEVDLVEESQGEFVGWYVGDWVQAHSRERYTLLGPEASKDCPRPPSGR
jgi:hypothetical protein